MTVRIETTKGAVARKLIVESMGQPSAQELMNLDYCLTFTSKLWLGLVDSELACAWGLVPATILSDKAYLWLHTTDKVAEHTFLFVRHSQRMVERMLEEFPLIHGMTDPRAEATVRWLKWLGATFEEPCGHMMPFMIRKR